MTDIILKDYDIVSQVKIVQDIVFNVANGEATTVVLADEHLFKPAHYNAMIYLCCQERFHDFHLRDDGTFIIEGRAMQVVTETQNREARR